ncbi:MAG: zinc-ribbon domain-containing protein, partial [Desulfuromonadaceae bacterium]
MNITCPHCEFSREVERSQIPPAAKTVICPRCKKRFELTGLTAPALAEPAAPVAEAIPEMPTAVPAAEVKVAMSSAARPKAGFWIRVVAALV